MAMNRIPCPECGAALKSPSGFAIGQTVCCPKCETYFVVEEPAEEDEAAEETNKLKKTKTQPTKATTSGKKPIKAATLPDDDEDEEDEEDRPKKKKKKRQDDDDDDGEQSYKNSPLRFAILGVLIVTMLVLGYFLYDKYNKKPKEGDNKETASNNSSDSTPPAPPIVPGGPKRPNGGPGGPGGPKGPNIGPGGPRPDGPKGPNIGPGGLGPQPGGPGVPGGSFGANTLTAAEKTKLLLQYKSQLIGTWKADLGGGVTAQLVYMADGKVTETITSPMATKTKTGTWSATEVVGRTGLFNRYGLLVTFVGLPEKTKPVELIFEEDELQHPIHDPILGQVVIGIFRKA